MTLTKVGDDWQVIRGRMKRLQYDLVREIGVCDWVWSVEQNPKGTGHHVHAWQRGEFVPQARLSELADYNGMGFRVDIRRWYSEGKGAESYGLKGIGYGLKGSAGEESARVYLEVNGARLTHQSRGFFEGGVRAAEQRGVERARAAGEQQDWQLVRVSDLASATSPAPRLGKVT